MYKISLNRIHDTVKVIEGSESLKLYVDGDAMRMVAGLSQAQKLLKQINNESTDEETKGAALYFAQVIFGKDQAEKLMQFYHDDAGCVINVCGRYFDKQLSAKITKAQKKSK